MAREPPELNTPMDQSRNTPKYRAWEAMLSALIAATIYCAVYELVLTGGRIRADPFMANFVIALPIGAVGLPLAGVPLARWLQRRGHDGIIQALTLGAIAGILTFMALMGLLGILLAGRALTSMTLTGMFREAWPLGLMMGAPGGALAAAAFLLVSRLRAHWRPGSRSSQNSN